MDRIDRELLNLLQKDSKMSIKELADQLNLTATPVFERIKKLEKNGYIERYTAIVNREKVGKMLLAFCFVSLKEHSQDYILKFENEVIHQKEVMECHHIAGHFDYLIKISTADMHSYQDFLVNKLAKMENIGNVQSSFVLKEIKNTTKVDI